MGANTGRAKAIEVGDKRRKKANTIEYYFEMFVNDLKTQCVCFDILS